MITAQQVQHAWPERDGECDVVFGRCQLDTESCPGDWNKVSCAGPEQRQCCSPSNLIFHL